MSNTAVIYARVSTQKQEYIRQIEDLKKYAAFKNTVIIGIFEEKISGFKKNEERPKLQEMLIFCKENMVDFVFASELSRVGRKAVEVLQFLEELHKIGVGLILQNPAIETKINGKTNPMAQLFFTMAAAFAEMEKSHIIERLSSGRNQAIQEGKKMGRKLGSIKNTDYYLEKYKKELNLLQKKVSMAQIEKLTGTSARTIQRLKKIIAK